MSLILDGSAGVTFPNSTVQASAGQVLQVVTNSYSTMASSTTNSYVDTGLSASITPKISSSKILVIVSLNCRSTSTGTPLGARIVRGASTAVQEYDSWVMFGDAMANTSLQGVDSPATTSSTTYKVQFKNRQASGTVFTQYGDVNGQGTSFITLMEVAV